MRPSTRSRPRSLDLTRACACSPASAPSRAGQPVRALFLAAGDNERINLACALGESALLPWASLLAAAAIRLTTELAPRIRGFRRAPAATIAERFLRRDGLLTSTPESVRVALAPSPWNVALAVSGFAGELAAPRWLDHRPVILVLEGL